MSSPPFRRPSLGRPIRIGTRGSPLALAQTDLVRARLAAAEPALADPAALKVEVIRTTGDRVLDRPLADVGGKGLFSKEIDEAMLARGIDIAVHSVKDLPTWLPDGIVLAAVLPREDPRDVLIAAVARLADLPAGALIGTSSPRRQAQILARRPDLRVGLLRGNVHTRLARVAEGAVAATLLARAGLRRLGLDDVGAVLDPEAMLPAVGQGAVGITCRGEDTAVRALLQAIDDANAAREVAAERAMLAVLDGSCRTPIGGLARHVAGGRLVLRGLVARPDGSRLLEGERSGALGAGLAMGADLGGELRARAGDGFFET
ncbi:MAG TPA: hydroxymethylbilane synthase [Rhodospirillales bacterium]|nr:hydroxymethylbilane synthase [Rhodospirillales bacterium]